MNRKMYQPTAKQEEKWALMHTPEMLTNEAFKTRWMKDHHGKLAGWGMGKRDWIVSVMKNTREYQMALWQGRVDAARGIGYQGAEPTDENANAARLGYHRGYCDYRDGGMGGWDAESRKRFAAEYIEA